MHRPEHRVYTLHGLNISIGCTRNNNIRTPPFLIKQNVHLSLKKYMANIYRQTAVPSQSISMHMGRKPTKFILFKTKED